MVGHPLDIYRNIGASPQRRRLGKSGTARKVLQYTLHYQRKVQCQDAMRQQLLAFVDPFPIAKNITGCLLSTPMMHNVKLVKMTLLTQQVFKTMGRHTT